MDLAAIILSGIAILVSILTFWQSHGLTQRLHEDEARIQAAMFHFERNAAY